MCQLFLLHPHQTFLTIEGFNQFVELLVKTVYRTLGIDLFSQTVQIVFIDLNIAYLVT